ncbi:MAG: hypothetical protein Q8R55_03250 [Candidatus Taylorbacteria bacterium]|nr:hypothetical protein [Candidatus Taylorbacteria bacterium]
MATEILKRKFSIPTALTRRLAHIGTAVVAVVAPLFVTQKEIVVVSIIFAIVLLSGRRYNIFSAIHSVERNTFGEIFLPLGVALTALFFLPHNLPAFQFGIFIMGISDALAGLIGEQYGKYYIKFLDNKKSVEGSLVFFFSSLILTFLFVPVLGYSLFLIPLLLTFIEFCLVYGLDNLVLPIAGAYLIQLLF